MKLSDYKDEITPNSELNINHYHAFYLKAKNVEQAYVRSMFVKSKSWTKDTSKFNYAQEKLIQKIRFDLYEVYARKFNKRIDQLRYNKSTTYEDLTKIGDSLFKEINIILYEIDDPETDKNEIIKKWRPIVDKMLRENKK